jgi:molybdopterin/thiamine biosynthesis adenylyltransferase
VVAGLLVEEARRLVMPRAVEDGPATQLNLVHLPGAAGALASVARSSSPRRLALVGAGALGNWFGLALGLSGARVAVHVFDHDEIEETNLNRQVLFHGAVGELIAPVLAARLEGWFPHLAMSGCAMKIERDTAPLLLHADALVACPDSFAVRSLLNDLGRQHRRPLISGGTTADSGSALVYAPGSTACLSCRQRIEQLAASERAPQGCGRRLEGSVVTSNAIVGALLVVLLRGLLAGRPEPGTLEYDGRPRNARLGRHSAWPACRCRGRGKGR